MKFLKCLAFASLAVAAPVLDARDSTHLDVQLEKRGSSKMKAIVRNFGSSDVIVLKTGTILDRGSVEKVQVTSGGNIDHHPLQRCR